MCSCRVEWEGVGGEEGLKGFLAPVSPYCRYHTGGKGWENNKGRQQRWSGGGGVGEFMKEQGHKLRFKIR